MYSEANSPLQITLWILPKKEPWNGGIITSTDVLKDRGSRYGFAYMQVSGKDDMRKFLSTVGQMKPFSSADHKSYAFRMVSPDGVLFEGKGDDGEAGAGLCILRELRRENVVNCCLIVSRHFWGIKLQNDRFKHVVNVAKIAIERMN
jgi:putative IMPACT (imprinted ancient) family translation regulator